MLPVAAALVAVAPQAAGAVPGATSTVFVNEIHYDNDGADSAELVEVAAPVGTDLTGWSVVLYNGSGGASYATLPLAGLTLTNPNGGYGFASVPFAGIQNGSPDGLALVDASGAVVQFLSYEGSFAATNGPAVGLTSTDIGVAEAASEPAGQSLQLSGTGTRAGDFTWTGPVAATAGAVNAGQTFGPAGPAEPVLNEVSASTAGADVEYLEIMGTPDTDYGTWSILEIQGITEAPDTPGQVIDVYPLAATDGSGRHTLNLAADRIENDPVTFLLVEDFTGAIGDDLDPGDDGTLDTTPWSGLADSLSILVTAGAVTYSPTVLDAAIDDATYTGASAGFAPGGASRLPDRTGAWVRNDFDLNPIQPGTPEAGEAANTPGAANTAVTVAPPPPVVRAIHDVQGTGPSVAITTTVTVEGVITSVFTNNDVRDAFFVQEEDADADADPATSEGIFVFCRGGCPTDPQVGDVVTVTGDPEEFFGMSQIDVTGAGGSIAVVSTGNPLPTPAPVALPAAGPTNAAATFEAQEGMLVTFPDTLSVSEYFELARYGQLVLSAGGRPEQFTDANTPSPAGYASFLTDLAARRIILDDDNNSQNDMVSGPQSNEPYPYPSPGLSTTNRVRGGDTITGLTGVLHWSFAGLSGTDAWRVRPVTGQSYTFAPANPRPATPPAVGGTLKVASFNVLNYFTTLEVPGAVCGPANLECRGANTAEELDRQRAKIVAAMARIDADVLGLIEIQNDAGASVADLVAALNAATAPGTYAFVDTGTIGTDAIKTAFVYRPAAVAPVGPFTVLDSTVDPRFIDDRNRPALIQTFEQTATGGRVTIALNHLKSKGSACDDIGDPDLADGQGNCNRTRTAAAEALADYLATDPTGSGGAGVLIMGDLNSYAKEDPVTALTARGYTDLQAAFGGDGAYSYLFDGQLGYLDHALADATLRPQVTGTASWHVNADEVPLFDYNDDLQTAGEAAFERESDALPLYEADPYRSSDHDPVLIGLDLTRRLSCAGVTGTEAELRSQGYNVIVGTAGNDVLNGTIGRDAIVGLGGNDTINGRLGDDLLCGGDGNDTVNGGAGADLMAGDAGDDVLDGDLGADTILGGAGADVLSGGVGDDMLDGGDGNDALFGGAGADRITGGAGDDSLDGELGNDTLSGGDGNDRLSGGIGSDVLNGDAGDDSLAGNLGTDRCDGGPQTTADTADRSCETITGVP
ncbi:MAG: ExeM/NucH family extracellular endonuclease [Acidimicrobiales bacterium]